MGRGNVTRFSNHIKIFMVANLISFN